MVLFLYYKKRPEFVLFIKLQLSSQMEITLLVSFMPWYWSFSPEERPYSVDTNTLQTERRPANASAALNW